MLPCYDWLVSNGCDWPISSITVSFSRSTGGSPMLHGSPVGVFLDIERPCFWNFYSTLTVDFVWVKSEMSCLFGRV